MASFAGMAYTPYQDMSSYYDRRSSGPPAGYGQPMTYAPYAPMAAAPREPSSVAFSENYSYGYEEPMEPEYTPSRVPSKGGPYQRRTSGKDEFDGEVQFLPKPSQARIDAQAAELLHLPVSLPVEEQDQILTNVNDCLSECAFDFVAKYSFPIPVEADKRIVRGPADREWTEWVYLLKRLATKRRIPARLLYNGQIKQLVTVLENSLEMRHAAKHQSRPSKDDRNVLQLISAGIQVAKILKDAIAMDALDRLYVTVEKRIHECRARYPGFQPGY